MVTFAPTPSDRAAALAAIHAAVAGHTAFVASDGIRSAEQIAAVVDLMAAETGVVVTRRIVGNGVEVTRQR